MSEFAKKNGTAGEEERSSKFYGEFEILGDMEFADREFDVTFASITRYYDDYGRESREDVIISAAHSLEELLDEAESEAHGYTCFDEFFSDLKRTGKDSVQLNDEGSIWVSIEYSTVFATTTEKSTPLIPVRLSVRDWKQWNWWRTQPGNGENISTSEQAPPTSAWIIWLFCLTNFAGVPA